MRANVLDLETMSVSGSLADGYALEPWRVRQGKAFIDSFHYLDTRGEEIMDLRPKREQLLARLRSLKGKEVWCWNAVFDVAFLIAAIEPRKGQPVPQEIRDIWWRDGLLLTKWVVNGQRADAMHYSFSLANVVSDVFDDDPEAMAFVAFKKGAPLGEDSAYWQKRGVWDCFWTMRVIEFMWDKLHESQRLGFYIEQACIPTIANSWLQGLNVNRAKLKQLEIDLDREDQEMQKLVNFPISAVGSPTQMKHILFGQMGLRPQKTTATGAPSTDVETLKLLAYDAEVNGHPHLQTMRHIMKLKNNSTVRSKYVKTVWEALERTGEECMYPVPQMFGTMTGRFTYSNTTGYRGPKVSFAAHQIPRKEKRVREYVEAPEDMWLSEYDAAGQESRLMACWSQDPMMVDIFQTGKDFHSMTGSGIVGYAYEDLKRMVDAEEAQAIEYRQMGKLANLACNYRIGGPALSKQAFVKYDMVIPVPVGFQLVNTFKRLYRGVPGYWDRAIDFSRGVGYATTATDRRYEISDWSKSWMAEQTALSHPIQGTGAEHKLIALATVAKKVPEAIFILDLHDASFFLVPNKECHEEVGHVLNTIDYSQWGQVTVNIPLPFDGKLGRSFKDVK